jgi:hypothetical protein
METDECTIGITAKSQNGRIEVLLGGTCCKELLGAALTEKERKSGTLMRDKLGTGYRGAGLGMVYLGGRGYCDNQVPKKKGKTKTMTWQAADVGDYNWSNRFDEVDRLHVKRNGITY